MSSPTLSTLLEELVDQTGVSYDNINEILDTILNEQDSINENSTEARVNQSVGAISSAITTLKILGASSDTIVATILAARREREGE